MSEPNQYFPKLLYQNFTASWTVPEKPAGYSEFPTTVSDSTRRVFNDTGISHLYKHQSDSIQFSSEGKNIVLVTGTGSGKSLCYQAPIIDSLVRNNSSTALLLFPTKALSKDQYLHFNVLLEGINSIDPIPVKKFSIGIYDGDTSKSKRISIRKSSNILISNPDMLHIGILPHHLAWSEFLGNLKYIVIDEIHTYKGVFGSHLSNVIRRLKRILAFYDATPQFILTSATIGNPKQLAEALIEEPVELIENDFSEQNQKNFIFYNPPVIDEKLGIRKSMQEETYQIANFLHSKSMQTIIFARTRKTVEQLLSRFHSRKGFESKRISAYRSGYLKNERRVIENDLKTGALDLVISTTALELGIDIGTVEAIILMGYPGSIARFLQQAGRAGRSRGLASLCVMVASPSPLDQYLIRHPEFIKGKNPEKVLIDPNNQFLLFHHLRCAAFELPFIEDENFGANTWDQISPYFQIFENSGILHKNQDKYFWKSEQYPANEVSLRSISGNPIMLVVADDSKNKLIGEIDNQSAKKMVYPGAVYLHNGQPFLVRNLDLEMSSAYLSYTDESVLTEPVMQVTIQIENQILTAEYKDFEKYYGEIIVREKISGFNRYLWDSHEIIDYHDLILDSDELQTKGIWITFSEGIIEKLEKLNLWTNSKNNYGSDWENTRKLTIQRDKNICQFCGQTYSSQNLHVHHIQPFRSFVSISKANDPTNLITLCPACHKTAEINIRMRSVLNGLVYGLSQIVPLFLSCDIHDLGYTFDESVGFKKKKPGIIIYDHFTGGIGLAENLFPRIGELFMSLNEIVESCGCQEGCPSCIGPPGENGIGAKKGVNELLKSLIMNENE